MSDRYALYVAPPAPSPLWRFGSAVLGYDAEAGRDVPQLVPEGFDAASFHALTEDPRRYGFHATLKAPFRLRDGTDEAELISALNAFALRTVSFVLPRLEVTALRRRAGDPGFVALVEPEPTAELLDLERACVEGFEPFRAPLTDAEVARRRPEALTERQRLYLDLFGYPYVFEEFRFHLTLTGRVPGPDVDRMAGGLSRLRDANAPERALAVDGLALFKQAGGGRFRILARAAFGR